MSTYEHLPCLSVWCAGHPVSVNHAYGSGGYGRSRWRYLQAEAREWRNAVRDETIKARLSARENPLRAAAYRLPLRVVCTFYGTRADADNLLKLTVDGLKAGLGIDDKHYAQIEAEKQPRFLVPDKRQFFTGVLISVWASAADAADSVSAMREREEARTA